MSNHGRDHHPEDAGPSPVRDSVHDISFEAKAYPGADEETHRLLAICRGAIRKFLNSGLGKSTEGSDLNADN